ncbi:MAG: hypothetical protein L0Z62_16525 [Gemmataceae bacterium]|nr:hypothetical protein [Gemmataceae bacterium]
MHSERPFDRLYLQLRGKEPPSAVTRAESDAPLFSPGRGFMSGFDLTMQDKVGCPAACLFCYVSTAFRLAPTDVQENWGFAVRTKRDVGQKLHDHLHAGELADRTIYWSGVTDPYATAPQLTQDVWEVLGDAPANLRPRRIAVQTRFRPDRDAGLIAQYVRSTAPSDGGPPVVVSYSVGTDRDDLIRAWERATPSFESRLRAIASLREAGIWVVATLSPFGAWNDLRGAACRLRELGVAYLTVLFFKDKSGGTTTPRHFLDYLQREFPDLLDPAWQAERLDELESIFGPGRVLMGQPGFSSLAAPHLVGRTSRDASSSAGDGVRDTETVRVVPRVSPRELGPLLRPAAVSAPSPGIDDPPAARHPGSVRRDTPLRSAGGSAALNGVVAGRTTLDHIVQNREALLRELRRRQGIVRDYVRGVARQYATGLYLFGRPGTAKTHTVRAVLDDDLKQPYCYQRGHLTPVGLFELLGEHADEVIVLDDLGFVLKSDVALQVLLSALEHPTSRDRVRVVKYKRQGHEERVYFRGGIICISNRELHGDEMLDAFKSRVNVLNYDPSNAQLGALMLDIAARRWSAAGAVPDVRPEEALEVAHFVIGELLRLGCRFDLRLFVNKALPGYRQWKEGEAESDWRDLVTASIEEHLIAVRHASATPATREDRKAEEHTLIRQLLKDHPTREARVRAWIELTGKSERAFYRRLAELE